MLSPATCSRVTRGFAPIVVLLVSLLPGVLSAEAGEKDCSAAADDSSCAVPVRKVRKPIRLISRPEQSAAGNYREIPLADTPEAAISERASDVLQKQTGVQLNRVGAPGTQSFLGLRGSNPDQVEYFIEDMPLPRPYNSPLNLEAMPVPLFRAVEIFPSFVPSHLPATNLGGALNFRLRELTAGDVSYLTQVSANSLLGSSAALARLSEEQLHFINFEQSRNRYRYLNNNGTTENSGDDRTELRQNEDFTRIGYTGFYRKKLGRSRILALVDLMHSDRGLPGTVNLPLTAVCKADDRASLAMQYKNQLNERHSVQLTGAATLDRSDISDPRREALNKLRQQSLSPQLIAGATYAFRTREIDAALHARGRYQSVTIGDSRIGERQEMQAALNAAWDYGLFRLAAQTGVTMGSDHAAANAFFASAEKTIEQKGLSASGIAALRPLVFFTDATKANTENLIEIYAQVSSAYRAPTLYERFGDNIFVTPSDNLRNERALTNAGGIRASARCLKQLVCSLRSEAWLTGASDYILFTQNSARTLVAVNASSAQIWGVENELALNWVERALLTLRYTYLDARDYGSVPYYQDKFLPQRPRHHAVASASVLWDNFRFLSAVEYRGAIFRDRYNSYFYYLPSKLLWDAGVDYTIVSAAKHILNVTLKNITDNQDPDVIGYSLPGRYLLVKWTAEF